MRVARAGCASTAREKCSGRLDATSLGEASMSARRAHPTVCMSGVDSGGERRAARNRWGDDATFRTRHGAGSRRVRSAALTRPRREDTVEASSTCGSRPTLRGRPASIVRPRRARAHRARAHVGGGVPREGGRAPAAGDRRTGGEGRWGRRRRRRRKEEAGSALVVGDPAPRP